MPAADDIDTTLALDDPSAEPGGTPPADPAPPAGETDDAATDDVPCADLPLPTRLEALLLSTERPLSEARLGELVGLPGEGRAKAVRAALDELNAIYEQTGRSFRATRLAGGWQLLTVPECGPLVGRLHRDRQGHRLSQAALETLAIIAYRQPIMRAEIEAIRGVACGEVLRGLLERRLVRVAGRAEEVGRPMLYGTTPQFLAAFGLAGIDDLPAVEGLASEPAPRRRAPAEPDAAAAAPSDAEPTDAEPTDETPAG